MVIGLDEHPETVSRARQVCTLVVASLTVFALGIVTAGFGPALPELAAQAQSDLGTIGSVITALFFGSLLMEFVAGPLVDRYGERKVLLGGLFVLGIGLLAASASSSLWLMLLAMVIAGFGDGAVILAVNTQVAEVFAPRRATVLNFVNVFFGIGAFAGPAIAGFTLVTWSTALPAIWIGALVMVAIAPLVLLTAAVPRRLDENRARPAGERVVGSPYLWAVGAVMLLYVGAEIGAGSWLPLYLERSAEVSPASGAIAASGFWLALTIGRVVGSLVAVRIAASRLLLASLIGSLVSVTMQAAVVGDLTRSLVAAVALGFFFGPIYPTAVSVITAAFPRTPGSAASIGIGMGSLGGLALPWLQGVLLERSGPFASAAHLAVICFLMVGFCLLSGRLQPTRRPGDSAKMVERSAQPAPSPAGGSHVTD